MPISKERPKSARGFYADEDGVTHINVYSKSEVEVGRLLTHFAYSPFTHPYFGPFISMEGFWYFMRNGRTDDDLRYLAGDRAKRKGKDGKVIWYPEFKEDILAGNYCKIMQNKKLKEELIESTLPFDHYYMFGKERSILVNARDSDWLVQGWEDLRTAIKADVQPECWVNAEKRYIEK